jgi:hypothetical protein
MCKLIAPFIIICVCFFSACGPQDVGPERKLKPYDPVKAGASIVESFDITGKIIFDDKYSTNYDIAEYNNTLYIQSNLVLYIFDKDNFSKIDEIKINNADEYFTYNNSGLAITADGDAFLLCYSSFYKLPVSHLYYIDLLTGDADLIDDSINDFINNYSADQFFSKMGYDTFNNIVWFQTGGSGHANFLYLYLTYDKDSKTFNIFELNDRFRPATRTNIWRINTKYDKTVWYSGYNALRPDGWKEGIGLYRYNLEDPSKEPYFINVEYLNTLTLPKNSHYDGEYIWLIVERNNQIQMLKLLPNG